MVAGRLAEKNGYFYIVLSYNGPDGKRVQKWQGTGLPVKGNKKKADELLRQARRAFTAIICFTGWRSSAPRCSPPPGRPTAST